MDAHADAVARAKAIAARLAGLSSVAAPAVPGGGHYSHPPAAPSSSSSSSTSGAPDAADVSAMLDAALGGGGGGGGGGGEGIDQQHPDLSRKRGVEAALASLIPGLGTTYSDSSSKRPRGAGDGGGGDDHESVKKIWIPSDRNPGYNYVGLLIGPGGSKQRELVASSGGGVRISIRGKGSNSKGGEESVPGMPEEPLHVLLEGRKDSVDRAEKLVRELLEDSEAADREKARQLGSMNPDQASIGGGASAVDGVLPAGGYTPKPVAQILGQTHAGSSSLSAYGPPGSSDLGGGAATTLEEKIGIPNGVVGFVIGRGGESIASMQRRTGCRVQIQKEHEMAPGTSMRVITLTANDPGAISDCRAIIEGMVRERMMANVGGGGGGGGGGMSAGGAGLGFGGGGGRRHDGGRWGGRRPGVQRLVADGAAPEGTVGRSGARHHTGPGRGRRPDHREGWDADSEHTGEVGCERADTAGGRREQPPCEDREHHPPQQGGGGVREADDRGGFGDEVGE